MFVDVGAKEADGMVGSDFEMAEEKTVHCVIRTIENLKAKKGAEAPFFMHITSTNAGASGYFVPLESFPMSEKSGRYIEITIDPMVTPRNAMRTGSIKPSRSAMAVSTSSS